MRRRPAILTALLPSVALLLASLPSLAAVVMDSVSGGVSVSPPGTVTLVVRVTNTGTAMDTFAVRPLPPSGWNEVDVGSVVELGSSEVQAVLLALRCPKGALAGDYVVSVRATSLTDPAVWAETFQTVTVLQVSGVELEAPVKDQGALPGALVTYPLVVRNRGNIAAGFEASAFSAAAPGSVVIPAFLEVPPGGQAEVVVRIAVPAAATPGQLLRSAVTVRSRIDSGVSDSVILATEVLPPPPDAVGGSLMQQLPSSVRLTVGEDLQSGFVSGDLDLSLAGDVEGGYFAVDLGVRSLFGPTPVDLEDASILYRCDHVSFAVGDSARRLTDLIQVACRGGTVEIDATNLGIVFLGGGLGGQTRAGGQLIVGPDWLNAGVTYTDERSASHSESIWGFSFAARPFEIATLALEGALGNEDGTASQGLLFGAQVDTGAFYLDMKVFTVDTEFPGTRGDSAGVTIAQHLRLPELKLSGSFGHTWDDIDDSPLVERTIREQLDVQASGKPLPEGPSLRSQFELTWDHGEDPAWKDLTHLRLAFHAEGGVGVFPYHLTAECLDLVDRVLGTARRDLSLAAGCGITFDSCRLSLTMTQNQERDLVANIVTGGSTGLAFHFGFAGASSAVDLDLASAEDALSADLSLALWLAAGLNVAVATQTKWDRGAPTDLDFRWTASIEYQFDLPVAFLPDKGRLTGRAFIDANGNGQWDPGEGGLGNLVVVVDGTQALTGPDGWFRFSPLPAGSYLLRASALPPDYVPAVPGATSVRLEAGKTTSTCLPVVRAASLEGRVAVLPAPTPPDSEGDLFVDGEGQAGDVLAGVAVTLRSADGEVLRTVTNDSGTFHFDRLRPGEWSVGLVPDDLPRFHTARDEAIPISLDAGEDAEVVLEVLVERRPVEIVDGGTLESPPVPLSP